MKYLSKLYVTFSFAGKERDKSRSDFIVSAIADIKEKEFFVFEPKRFLDLVTGKPECVLILFPKSHLAKNT